MDLVCIFHIFVVVLIKTSSALLFISPTSYYHRWPHESTLLRYYNENTDIDNTSIGRRQLLHGTLLSPVVFKNIATYADDSLVAKAICDTTTIESYQKGRKKIHLVGTAHISSESSRLSRDVVREIKPEAVFLELDLQRVSRAFRNGQVDRPITILFFTGEDYSGGGSIKLQSAVLAPQNLLGSSSGISQMLQKLIPKNPIEQMYESLEAQGITPGEEFITAVEEGGRLNSLIILGDRRMDITLKRIANALIYHTNPKALLEADKKITAKLKASMPDLTQLEAKLKQERRELSTEELASFVERLKTKDITMSIMTEMKRAAPQLHQALVGERDVYMARGMNAILSSSLASVLPPSSVSGVIYNSNLQNLVAVIGLGHIHGVGNELKALGWKSLPLDNVDRNI